MIAKSDTHIILDIILVVAVLLLTAAMAGAAHPQAGKTVTAPDCREWQELNALP